MNNLRKYGMVPYTIAVVHGGPGAPGEMACVARELAKDFGVLEPLQTVDSIAGQVQELKQILEKNGELPMILIGHSWGAWLVYIFAAQYPGLVKKIILVGSGPFDEKYAAQIMETRLNRLNKTEKNEARLLLEKLNNPQIKNDEKTMARFGELMSKTDFYEEIIHKNETIKFDFEIYQKVWLEASNLRKNGMLLNFEKNITCPVVAIHGDFDSHPAAGVKKPLSHVLKNFRFILLKKCGHEPWYEKQAVHEFYRILKQEILN